MNALLIAALLAADAPAAADKPLDFTEEAKLLYRVVACGNDSALPEGIDAKVVDAHCKELNRRVEKYRATWVAEAQPFIQGLKPAGLPTTVVYPFGGGDLISALTTYPEGREYTTMSLEHAGDPRRIKGITKQQLKDSLALIRSTSSGLLTANDSKTENLMKGQRGELPGQLCFFLIALAVHGYEPVSLKYVKTNADGSLRYLTDTELTALEKKEAKLLNKVWVAPDFSEAFDNLELVFVKKGGDAKDTRVHRHFAANLNDDNFGKDAGMQAHLNAKGRIVAMTKAASYLLWRDQFSTIRNFLLTHMEFMVSDSTGIPPSIATKAGFTQTTFGKFNESFLNANPVINKEFRELWKDAKPLAFRYGYLDKGLSKHMLITQKAAATEVMLAVALLALGQVADEGPTPARALISTTVEGERVEQLLDDGQHLRFGTKDSGPVHVWRPRAYRKDTARIVIYLHGFYTDVDKAMTEHQLAAQFRDSGLNALFVVPEARSARTDAVIWAELPSLLDAVEQKGRVALPAGPITVVGHSGAYKTIAGWLGHERVERVVLIDGLYGNDDDFRKWLEDAQGKPRQLVLVGFDTQQRVEWLTKKHAAVKLDTLPYLYDELPAATRKAPLLTLQSERFDHMGLVTEGRLMPWLLHALR